MLVFYIYKNRKATKFLFQPFIIVPYIVRARHWFIGSSTVLSQSSNSGDTRRTSCRKESRCIRRYRNWGNEVRAQHPTSLFRSFLARYGRWDGRRIHPEYRDIRFVLVRKIGSHCALAPHWIASFSPYFSSSYFISISRINYIHVLTCACIPHRKVNVSHRFCQFRWK